MKKLLFLLICLCSLTKLTAQQSSDPAVSFVSYEQNWSDREGSQALRNNTNKRIFNISFQLVYYNMDGQQIDYENFFRTVSIDAGMTREVDVPAYERDRNIQSLHQSDTNRYLALHLRSLTRQLILGQEIRHRFFFTPRIDNKNNRPDLLKQPGRLLYHINKPDSHYPPRAYCPESLQRHRPDSM